MVIQKQCVVSYGVLENMGSSSSLCLHVIADASGTAVAFPPMGAYVIDSLQRFRTHRCDQV